MKIGEKNPLIHKNPFAYCRSTIRILFPSLFKLVKTASEGALSGACFTRFIP